MGLVAFLDSVVCRLCDHGIRFRFFINPYNFVPGGVYGAGIVLHNIFPSIQVGTFGYMFDVPLMITAVLVSADSSAPGRWWLRCSRPVL